VERLCQNAVPAILPNPLRFFFKGMFSIPFAVFGTLLFFLGAAKEKKQKKTALLFRLLF
jgi:hypothetical protein